MNAAKAVTGVNKTPSSIEMDTENAVVGGNETPTPSSKEKLKEIQAEIKKMRENIAVCTGKLYASGFMFRRKKERRERIGVESPQTMTEMQTERKTDEKSNILRRKHEDQLGVETFKEGVEPTTTKNSVKDSSEASALIRFVQKLDLQEKDMSDLKSVLIGSLQEETEKQKSDGGKKERNIKLAVRMMTALRGSSCRSDSDYAVFKSLKGSFDDHFREVLRQNGVLGSTKATLGGEKKETNTDSVIQSLAKRYAKEMQLTFFGSNSVFDPSDELDVKTIQILEAVENHMRELYCLYLAEESEKNKMVNNGADLKRKKTENIDDCDVKRPGKGRRGQQ